MMKIRINPKTNFGKWSFRLFAMAFFLFLMFNLLVISGQTGGEKLTDNLLLSVPALVSALLQLASFIFGVISVIKDEERSLLVYLAILIGLVLIIFLVGEFAFPH